MRGTAGGFTVPGRRQCPSCNGCAPQVFSSDGGALEKSIGSAGWFLWVSGSRLLDHGFSVHMDGGKFSYNSGERRPWLLELRSVPARGFYNRLAAGSRLSTRSILGEVRFRLKAMSSHAGLPAFQVVFGSNPVDLFLRQDDDSDSQFAYDTLIPGRLAQLWRLNTLAQQWKNADVKLRRLLVHKHSFARTSAAVGNSALPYEVVSRKSTPRRRGPPMLSDIDEVGVAAKFRGRTFKVARFCVPQRVDPKESGEVQWNPAFVRSERLRSRQGRMALVS